jgi:hypothetical protein
MTTELRWFGCGSLALASAFVASCTIETTLPPAYPPNPPQGPPAKLLPGVANGTPKNLGPGGPKRLMIWRSDDGIWHIRSTTAGERVVFRGRVVGATSPISWAQPELVEVGDALSHQPNQLVFRFETAGHVDAVNFVPDDRQCVTFHITADEQAQPQLIDVGPSGAHPPSDHFTLCP